jgi:aspartate carbamoyltransferase regulatory subunit
MEMITEIMKKTDNMPCIKHNYHPVNNRYDEQGKPVISGGEWVTEIRCEVCDKKFEEPKWKEKVI